METGPASIRGITRAHLLSGLEPPRDLLTVPTSLPTLRARRPCRALAAALLAIALLGAPPTSVWAQSDATVVYLVRHAERAEDGTSDPPISEAGEARSRLLAGMLLDAGVTHVHTTDYKRTRSTGAPTTRATFRASRPGSTRRPAAIWCSVTRIPHPNSSRHSEVIRANRSTRWSTTGSTS